MCFYVALDKETPAYNATMYISGTCITATLIFIFIGGIDPLPKSCGQRERQSMCIKNRDTHWDWRMIVRATQREYIRE